MTDAHVLQVVKVRKKYQSLRPLRLNDLCVDVGERVALSGLDAGAAEVLVNLVTGASLPDEGEVRVFGRATASIADGDEWLASLDRFGIVSPRAVLLDAANVLQNLVMPLTLAIDEIPEDAEHKARALARDAGIADEWLDRPVAALPAAVKARVHLVRAVALEPALLVLEHPTVGFSTGEGQPFGQDVARVALARRMAVLMLSEDADFASTAATRRLALHGASGDLKAPRRTLFGW
jgi:predicted ABC-type transport system involved in lysophospholipase L1 biosynthesis ATPase subunit